MRMRFYLSSSLLVAFLAIAPFIFGAGPAQAQTSTPEIVQRAHELMTDTEALRKLYFTAELPVELVSQEQIKGVIAAELRDQITPEMDKGYSSLYALLGLMPEGSSLIQDYQKMADEQVAGLYDPSDKKFYVVNLDMSSLLSSSLGDLGGLAQGIIEGLGIDMSGIDQSMTDAVIVHELTHALDDQHYDLEHEMKMLESLESDDASLAYQSLVEGDATRIMNDYVYNSTGVSEDMAQNLSSLNGILAESMMNYNPFLERLMTAPYFKGEEFVRYIIQKGGDQALDRAFKSPPESMEQVLHPERYLPNADYPSMVADPDLSRALPGWKREAKDSLGELIIETMFEFGLNDKTLAERIANGWDADKITSWRSSNGELGAVWITVWDDSSEASEFFTNIQTLIDTQYSHDGFWTSHGSQSSIYNFSAGSVAIEINDTVVVVVDGIPSNKIDACMEAAWNTPVTYR